jgi:hypothetical protein
MRRKGNLILQILFFEFVVEIMRRANKHDKSVISKSELMEKTDYRVVKHHCNHLNLSFLTVLYQYMCFQ